MSGGRRASAWRDPARRRRSEAAAPDPQRHYETSLDSALRENFRATEWLVGADLVAAAARAYVRARPPRSPASRNTAETFRSSSRATVARRRCRICESFAELECAVADVSIAIDFPPLAWPEVASIGPERLLDSSHAATGRALSALGLGRGRAHEDVLTEPMRRARSCCPKRRRCVEIRGARGTVRMTRLELATFAFARRLQPVDRSVLPPRLHSSVDANFDAGSALVQSRKPASRPRLRPSRRTIHDPTSAHCADRLERFPLSIIQLAMRIAVGAVFFRSGLLKVNSWEFAVQLFRDEYKVPLLDPVSRRTRRLVELGVPSFCSPASRRELLRCRCSG